MHALNPVRYTIAELLETRMVTKLARKIGVDPSSIYRWRDGKVMPSGKNLQDLARECGVEASQIDLSNCEAARAS